MRMARRMCRRHLERMEAETVVCTATAVAASVAAAWSSSSLAMIQISLDSYLTTREYTNPLVPYFSDCSSGA